jgi:molecular chaperone Hsp33
MSDQLLKSLFEGQGARVEIVQLDATWREIIARHQYPTCIQRLLGELVCAASLLSANLKFNGALVLQIQGDGPVGLLLVECQADLSLRATVKLRGSTDALPDDMDLQSLLNPKGGGRFSIILDPLDRLPGQQPYQGIVPLEGSTVAELLEHYMASSEQLQTRLWLAADGQRAGGLLLQKLPDHGGQALVDADLWDRAQELAATVKRDELLRLRPEDLLRRLYWQETLHVFDPLPVRHHCACSRERVASVIRSLGQAEADSILSEQGSITISCDYCVKDFVFDAVDVAELFARPNGVAPAGNQTRH